MESLGIPNYGPWYVKTSEKQSALLEMKKISEFVKSVLVKEKIQEFKNTKSIQFINYGSTQLVYVLTSNKQYTLLVTQPDLELGIGKKEFNNSKKLSDKNSNVVKPLYYFCDELFHKELYITPYEFQARCIGIETNKWGMWVPEPSYHFKIFNKNLKQIINASMIALIIKFYDEEAKQGIVKLRLDGGDFMLKRGFEKSISYENVIDKLKLIAARDTLTIELEDYVKLLRLELSGNTKENIIVGKTLKESMSGEAIETGIFLGYELRKEKRLIKSLR